MNFLEKIRQPIFADMQLYNNTFAETLSTENPMLMNISDYVVQKSGDKFRPTLALLCAKICGEVNSMSINGALSLELLYIASVIHDDVVDENIERHGAPSLNTRWTNKIAILSGDYILSKSLSCGIQTDNLAILKSIASIGMQLSDGELLKLMTATISKESVANYFQLVRKKTAYLFGTCAEVGALSVDAPTAQLHHLKCFGEYLGISFQIKQDILNLADDLQDGKLTLPLIYALQQSASPQVAEIIKWVEEQNFSTENADKMHTFILNNGGIQSAEEQIQAYKQKAIDELNDFADSEVKQSLILCAEYAAE